MFAAQTLPDLSTIAASAALIGAPDSDRGYEHKAPRAPWLMVPVDGQRSVTLNFAAPWSATVVNASKEGYVRDAAGTLVCLAKIYANLLLLRGVQPRKDIPIDLVVRGKACRVMVSTKRQRTLPIIAHYVEHAPGLQCRTTPADLREMIAGANKLLGQANVRLMLATQTVLPHERIFRPEPGKTNIEDLKRRAATTLGRTVDKDEWFNLLARHKTSLPNAVITRGVTTEYRPLNVFLVRRFEPTSDRRGVIGMADPAQMVIIEDVKGPAKAAYALAHEVMHYLMFEAGVASRHHHIGDDPDNLMFPALSDTGRLSRDQIETINVSPPAFPLQTVDPFVGGAGTTARQTFDPFV